MSKWDKSEHLKGLSGITPDNVSKLYECEAKQLLEEENKEDNWHVYMVECSDGSLYTGISNNVSKRVSTHNSGKGAKYTKTRLPVLLKGSWWCGSRSDASILEYNLKRLSRKEKLELING